MTILSEKISEMKTQLEHNVECKYARQLLGFQKLKDGRPVRIELVVLIQKDDC